MDTREQASGLNEATRAGGWLTIKDTARELQIPLSRAYMLVQSGDLPAVRVGEKSLRVNRRELEEFLISERRAGPGEHA